MEAATEGEENRVNYTPAPSPSYAEPQERWSSLTVTHVLVAINVAVFVLMVVSGASPIKFTPAQLIRWGANWGPLSLGPQPWRVLTSNYVHIAIWHIGFNMWCLWDLGRLAERLLGRWSYVLVYTLSGIAGSVASLSFHPYVVGAGASGAIFGLAGAVLPVLYFGHLSVPRQALKPILNSLVAFVGYNLLFGAVLGADNFAHLGGLVGGLFLGFVISRAQGREEVHRNAMIGSALLAVILAGVLMTLKKGHPQLAAADLDPDAGPKAIAAYNAGHYEDAIRYLTVFTKQNPKSASAQVMLGGAYLAAKRPKEAIAPFQAALALRPDYALPEEGLGEAYRALGMEQESQDAYKKAAQMKK